MWITVLWFDGVPTSAWMPPSDLWDIYAPGPAPSDKHVLAEISDDGPYRWFIRA